MKKRKEEEMLDTQEKEFDVKDEDEEKLRNKTLKSTQKGIVKRKDFRYLTNNVGKGKNHGLRKIEVVEGDEIICIRNKDEIERLIIT